MYNSCTFLHYIMYIILKVTTRLQWGSLCLRPSVAPPLVRSAWSFTTKTVD